MCAKFLQLCLILFNPLDISPSGVSSMGFFRQEYWSGFPFQEYIFDPGIKPISLVSPALAGGFFIIRATLEAQM